MHRLKTLPQSLTQWPQQTSPPLLPHSKHRSRHVSELVDGMSKGQGSVGKLMTNDSLYTNLNNTLYNLDLLLQDMQANPKKYVHFSLFGKKDE